MIAVSKYESKDRVRVIILTETTPSPMPHTTDGIEDCPQGAKIMPLSLMFVASGTKYIYYSDELGWVEYKGSITIDNLNHIDDDSILYSVIFSPEVETGGGGGYPEPTGVKNLTYTANGDYSENIKDFATVGVTVNVPEPTGTKEVTYTANGENTEDIKDYENVKVTVNVPEPTGKKEITANGDNINIKDFEFVKVNVPNPSTGTKNITENGTYDVTDFASAEVNVSGSDEDLLKKSFEQGVDSYTYNGDYNTVGPGEGDIFRGVKTLSMPGITSLSEYAFSSSDRRSYFSTNDSSVSLPDVTSIDNNYVFYWCRRNYYHLINCNINTNKNNVFSRSDVIRLNVKSLQNVGSDFFYNCSLLTTVSISDNTAPFLQSIGDRAFFLCGNLKSMKSNNWSDTVSIGSSAFSLSDASGSYPLWTSQGLNAGVSVPLCISIGEQAFRNQTALPSFSAPLLTSIANKTFERCCRLTTVDFPKVTTIAQNAFGYTGLTSIKLPKVTSLGDNVFYHCEKMTTLDIGSANIGPSTLYRLFGGGANSLNALILRKETGIVSCSLSPSTDFGSNCPIIQGTGYIYVPRALVSTYQAATNWSTVASQFRALEDYTVDGTTSGELDPTKI